MTAPAICWLRTAVAPLPVRRVPRRRRERHEESERGGGQRRDEDAEDPEAAPLAPAGAEHHPPEQRRRRDERHVFAPRARLRCAPPRRRAPGRCHTASVRFASANANAVHASQ